MCRTPREVLLKSISSNNSKLIKNIIVIIDNNIKVNLYKELENNNRNTNNLENINEFKKVKSFYKQTLIRLLSVFEKYAMKKNRLLDDVEEGKRILAAKQSATVQSPNYGSEASFNDGYMPNTYEKKLHAIEEELEKQNQRIDKYNDFVNQHEEEVETLTNFIELSPNVPGVEAIIRHNLKGNSFSKIENDLCYSNLRTIYLRALDDLAMILMFSL